MKDLWESLGRPSRIGKAVGESLPRKRPLDGPRAFARETTLSVPNHELIIRLACLHANCMMMVQPIGFTRTKQPACDLREIPIEIPSIE